MAAKGNAFAILESDDDGENQLDLPSIAAVKSEAPSSAVNKRSDKTRKIGDSALSSSQSSSGPQRSSDQEKGREKWHGTERYNNRNGMERQNRTVFVPPNVQQNGFRLGNRSGSFNRDGFERKNINGYVPTNSKENAHRQNNGGGNVVKQREGNPNGHQTKEEASTDGWQVVVRSNGNKHSNLSHEERNANGRERKQHLEQSGEKENGVANAGNDEKEYRNKKGGLGGNIRASRSKGKFNRTSYQQQSSENTTQGKQNGKLSELIELSHDKEVQNALPQEDEMVSKELDSSKVNHDKVHSKEESERTQKMTEREAERELEAKQMTLQQYEKLLEEKRKVLESLKAEERRVALDKEFESMRMIEKKEETNFAKPNSATEKPNKKVANNRDDNNAHKIKHIIYRRPRTNNSGGNGLKDANSDRRQVAGDALMNVELSFKDGEQFPALDRSTKPK